MSTSTDHVAGQVFTAANADNLAQGILGVGTSTSNSSETSGTTTLDILSASAVTIAATGRRLLVVGTWRSIIGTVAGDVFVIRIQEGSTVLDEQSLRIDTASTGKEGGVVMAYVSSPSAASHTYKMTLTRALGTGTAHLEGAATYPLKVIVQDAGTT